MKRRRTPLLKEEEMLTCIPVELPFLLSASWRQVYTGSHKSNKLEEEPNRREK